ncbi:Retrovirus-related Pol polyprotein from transposon RE1 [Vitis vinifera]|uniref:Retrovirus-related Pol polyprotein from transposon RE1 n=1 Tax=Vitis vinifera TaxID=29760 RepID=A0A438E2A0_VITVI|nr:Retrovirus-related Pol polyprotein from transposon RE1 [Vitis vinifera]
MAFSSSASSNVIFAPPNIGHLVSIKLSDTNYLIRSSHIVPVLKSHDLMGFVDGSESCPSKSLDGSLNPAYILWNKKDQCVLSWINATLSDKVLASVYGITSAREVWSSLANKFASQSRTRVHHLKGKLQTLHQGSMKCTDFLEKAKLVSDELVAVGKPLEDDDLMSYIVSGLNPSFNPFITSLSFATRDKNVSFEDFQAELLSYELLLENQNIAIPPETNNFAFFTPKSNQQQYNRKPKNPSKPYSRPSFSQNPRPRYSPQPSGLPSSPQPNQKQHSFSTPKSPCQICGKLSHKALDCFHRTDYAYQGHHPPTQLAAMVAHSNVEQEEETWFADSGANQHITANLEHLTLQQPYTGQENVAVGNGQGLSIAHTGTTIFHTPEAKLNLKRVLHCPQASANLLSINQLCLDNNCLFILTGTHYFVKDIQTGMTLLEGRSEGGLYPIQLRPMSINKSHALLAVVGIKASVSVWHSRLGHASLPIVSQLLNKHSLPVEGSVNKMHFCESCQLGKGYSSYQNGYRCLDPVTQKVLISRHVVFNENTFPAKDGLQSSELLPVVSSQDSPDSPLESLPIPTSPHISTLPSPIPGLAHILSISEVSSSSNHSHHPMTTRSQIGNLKPRTFSDFKLYSTQYPLQALSSTVTPLAPTSYRQAALLLDWCVAMREEYDALLANETWKLCPRPVDHNVVGNKWVYKVKQTSTGEVDRFKARLVALGFAQEKGIDFTETFSPIIKSSTVRVLLTLSVQFDWEIRQLDVSNAFLHGILLENVYMEQPKGFVNSDFPDYVCKLNKSLYGLKQAPRAWFMRLSQTLLEFGFLSSPVDASLFVYHKGHIHLFILIYVDDILVTGYFLGIQASRDSSGLHLRQSKYIGDLLHRTKMAGSKPASSPCTIGLKLSTHVAAKRVLRYLKGTIDLGLWYTKGEQTLQAFCDSDWAGNPDDRRSTIGYGIFFGSCLISWTAKKQSVVARSSIEAEYRALAITIAELYWIRMLLKELHISLPTVPTIWCDNNGTLALASNPVFHARTKHIEVDFHFIREKVANRDISLQFIGSYDQPADIFTKGLSLARFCLLRDKLMVVSLPVSLRGDDNHNIQTTEISLASHLSYPPDQLRLNETNKHLSTLRDNP